MTDEQIDADWIREQLVNSGKSQREFAAALGIDPSGVSRLLDGRRKLKAEELPAVRAFFRTDESELPGSQAEAARFGDWERFQRKRGRIASGPKPLRRSLDGMPIYAVSGLASGRFKLREGPPAEYRPLPPQLVGVSGAFGIFVPDDTLSPRLRSGEVVYFHPCKPPVPGADVLVKLRASDGFALLRYQGLEGSILRFLPIYATDATDIVRFRQEEVEEVGRVAAIAME